jgi:hypothetical protein
MTNSTPTRIDWEAAETLAARLGIETQRLVAARDLNKARKWVARRAFDNHHGGEGNARRAESYSDLKAVLAGFDPAAEEYAEDVAIERSLEEEYAAEASAGDAQSTLLGAA